MITLGVRVHPGAAGDAVAVLEDGTLDVRVRARAVEGKANDALVRLLAARSGLRRRGVRLASGARSRRKLVQLDLGSMAELRARLDRP